MASSEEEGERRQRELEDEIETEEEVLVQKEENKKKSVLTDQRKVIFDGNNYKYTDSNNVTYVWDAAKNNWEKWESESDLPKKTKEENLCGSDGTHHTCTDSEDKEQKVGEENKTKEEVVVEKEENEKKSVLTDQRKVIFDGNNYKYTDSNNVTYVWDAAKNNWEKWESESNSTTKPKEENLYGFDGIYHTYTDPKDNTVYFWDKDKNAWFPKIDDDFLAQYQMNYGFIDNTSSENEQKKKEIENSNSEANLKRKVPQEASWFDVDDEHNTKVYVSNLPLDITEEEFINLMQKCGLIMKDIKTSKWKVKLYTQKGSQTLKGDALCTYIKKESVDLALSILDGSEFKGNVIKVERAKFQMKGEYNPALKPKRKRRLEKEKEKKFQEMLLNWRPDKLRGEREKRERTVIIKNLFEPSMFNNNIELILEYTQDLREECAKCGEIKKLLFHDTHPEGVAQVTFSDAMEADVCISLLNNRWFGQRKITAQAWDGKTKYKVVEKDTEEKERLKKWNNFLEAENPK